MFVEQAILSGTRASYDARRHGRDVLDSAGVGIDSSNAQSSRWGLGHDPRKIRSSTFPVGLHRPTFYQKGALNHGTL
jgi:hypothetical protein